MAFLHVYINGIYTVQRCDYHQQLVQGEYTPRDMAFSAISEWDLHGSAATTTSSLCRKEKWDMAFLRIYQNGITTALRLLPAACATREKIYTQGHGILHVYIRMGSTGRH
jgi:hypothetical protein